VESVRLAADAERGDRLSGEHEQRSLGVRRGSPGVGQVVIDPCMHLPVTSTEPVTSLRLEVLASLALRRASGGEMAKSGGHYFDEDHPTPGDLVGAFDDLTDPVARPQFLTRIPAGRHSSTAVPPSAPGGQPDPSPRAEGSGAGPLRWARCSDERRLHLLARANIGAAAGGDAQALCGHWLPAEALTITHGPPEALCLDCVTEIHATSTHPHLRAGSPGSSTDPLAGGGVGG
jgi:hypothetical protein